MEIFIRRFNQKFLFEPIEMPFQRTFTHSLIERASSKHPNQPIFNNLNQINYSQNSNDRYRFEFKCRNSHIADTNCKIFIENLESNPNKNDLLSKWTS